MIKGIHRYSSFFDAGKGVAMSQKEDVGKRIAKFLREHAVDKKTVENGKTVNSMLKDLAKVRTLGDLRMILNSYSTDDILGLFCEDVRIMWFWRKSEGVDSVTRGHYEHFLSLVSRGNRRRGLV